MEPSDGEPSKFLPRAGRTSSDDKAEESRGESRDGSISTQPETIQKLSFPTTRVVPPLVIIPPPQLSTEMRSPNLPLTSSVTVWSPATLQPGATPQATLRTATTSRFAGSSTIAARMLLRKFPLTPVIPSELTADGDPSIPAMRDSFLSHAILLDFVAILSKLPLGIFVIPNVGFQGWECAIFITEGLYRTGVFRFILKFPESYPNGKLRVTFAEPFPYHPLVNQITGDVYLAAAGDRCYSSVETLDFVKQMFYNVELLHYSHPMRTLSSNRSELSQFGRGNLVELREPEMSDAEPSEAAEPSSTESLEVQLKASKSNLTDPHCSTPDAPMKPLGEADSTAPSADLELIPGLVVPTSPTRRLELIDNCIMRSIATWSSANGLKFFAHESQPEDRHPDFSKEDFVEGMLQIIPEFAKDPNHAKELLINWIEEKAELTTRTPT